MSSLMITYPCIITPMLNCGVQIGAGADAAWVGVEPTGFAGPDGKPSWWIQIVAPSAELEYEDNELCGWGDAREMLQAALDFLAHSAERYRYNGLRHDVDDGEDALFPPAVVEWAYQHSDELEILAAEIEEPHPELED